MKLQAHTMLVVLVISFVIFLLCGALMMHAQYQKQILAKGAHRNEDILSTYSGLNILMACQEENTLLLEEISDSIVLSRKKWGLYDLVTSSSSEDIQKCALVANVPENKICLYVRDNPGKIKLVGKTILRGDAYVPPNGLERGYESGTPFEGVRGELIDGTQHESSTDFPKCDKEIVKRNKGYLHFTHLVDHDYVTDYEDSLKVSFTEDPVFIHKNNPLVLSQAYFSGNVVISSASGIIVRSSCQIEDVLLYAPYIIIDDDFKGTVQVFATDSIIIGQNCKLDYPSSLSLLAEDHFWKQRIEVGKNSALAGSILIDREKENHKIPSLVLSEDSQFEGVAYINGELDHQGYIYGSVWCYQVKENLLKNATIDVRKIDEHLLVSPLIGTKKDQGIAKWLN